MRATRNRNTNDFRGAFNNNAESPEDIRKQTMRVRCRRAPGKKRLRYGRVRSSVQSFARTSFGSLFRQHFSCKIFGVGEGLHFDGSALKLIGFFGVISIESSRHGSTPLSKASCMMESMRGNITKRRANAIEAVDRAKLKASATRLQFQRRDYSKSKLKFTK